MGILEIQIQELFNPAGFNYSKLVHVDYIGNCVNYSMEPLAYSDANDLKFGRISSSS